MDERPSLSRAIQDLGLASDAQLEEAWARQVIYGGELDLNILELGVIDEVALAGALARTNGLPSAPPGPLSVDVELTRKLAEAELCAVAGRTSSGQTCLFVETPLTAEQRKQAEAIVGGGTPEVSALGLRIREARAFSLGQSLSPRPARLLDRLGRLEKGVSVAPISPPASQPQAEEEAPPSAPRPHEAWEPRHSSRPVEQERTAPPPGDYEGITRKSLVPPPRTSIPPKTRVVTYGLDVARADIEAAEDRDAVIDVLVTFAEQFFEYVAVFAMQAKEARGLAARGPGATAEQLPDLRIPLDLPSAFSKAKKTGMHGSTRIRASGLEGGVARDLGRPTGRAILLLPIHLRGRPVLLVWGDQGEEDATPEQIAPVLALADAISTALERILLALKASRLASPPQSAAMPPVEAVEKTRAVPPVDSPSVDGAVDVDEPTRNVPPARGAHGEQAARGEPPSDMDLTRRRTSLSLPHIKEPAYRPGRRGIASSAPPPVERRSPGAATSAQHSAPPPNVDEQVTPSTGRKREPTHRNLAAPQAGNLDWSDATQVSGPSEQGPSGPRHEEAPGPDLSSKHTIASAERRALRASRPGIVTEHPSEAPRTLKGFPNSPRTPVAAPVAASPLPRVAAPLLSRRIVALSDPPKGFGSELEQRRRTPIDAPPPDIATFMNPPGAQPLSPAATLVSRRPSMMEEPPEDGWDAPAQRTTDASGPRDEVLIASLLAGDETVLDQLADRGEAAVGSLISRFPGPTSEPADAMAKASECGPILKALAHVGKRAVPFLTVRTADEDANVRRWATHLLGELQGKEAARAIAKRLLDDTPEVRRAALTSARMARQDTLTRRTLRAHVEEMIRDPQLAKEERALAIEALADIREHEAIPTLLQLLDDSETTISRSSRWALGVLTRQDFGNDSAAWRQFWQQHRDEDRIEWLILALDNEQEELRRAALDELRLLSGETFGYSPTLPPGARRNVQAQFRAWWNDQPKK